MRFGKTMEIVDMKNPNQGFLRSEECDWLERNHLVVHDLHPR